MIVTIRILIEDAVAELQSCTPAELKILKSQVIELDREVQSHKDHATMYDKKRLYATLHELWSALDAADRKLNPLFFQFHGDPIPPENLTRSTIREESKEKLPTAEPALYENILRQNLTVEVKQSTVFRHICGSKLQITVPSLHIDDSHYCAWYIHSEGPIFIHNMTNCVLITASHQLRLHNMVNCAVFADVGSGRAVIEHCDNVTFGGYSRDTKTLTSSRFGVDDFNWPTRATESPHYSTVERDYCWKVPDGERWGEIVWEHTRGEAWLHGEGQFE